MNDISNHDALIQRYHDGELNDDERRQVEAMLEDPAARAELSGLQGLSSMFGDLPRPMAPQQVAAAAHAAISEADTEQVVFRFGRWSTAVAAAVFLAASAALPLTRQETQATTQDPISEAFIAMHQPASTSQTSDAETALSEWLVEAISGSSESTEEGAS